MTIRAKLLLFASVAALSAATLSCAQENKPAVMQDAVHQHLQRIVDANTWQTGDSKPFYLKLNFEVFDLAGKSERTGTLERWVAGHRILTKIEGRDALVTPSGSQRLPGRDGFLVDLLLGQILQPVMKENSLQSVKLEENDRKFGSATLHCITPQGNVPLSDSTHFLVCTSTPGDVVRIDNDSAATVVRNRIAAFREKPVPLEISVSYGEHVAIKATVAELKGIAEDDSHLPPPDQPSPPPAVPGHVMSGSKISGQAPTYPSVAKARHQEGSVVVGVLISKSGELTSPVILASPDEALSEAAVNALKTWKYKPYLLDGNPTEVAFIVVVNFNLIIR